MYSSPSVPPMTTSNTGGYSAPKHHTMMRTPPPSGVGTAGGAAASSNDVDPFASLGGGNSMTTTSSSTPQQYQQNYGSGYQSASPSPATYASNPTNGMMQYQAQPTPPPAAAAGFDPFAGITSQSQAQQPQQQRPMEMFQTPQPTQTYQSPQPMQAHQSPQQPMSSSGTSSYAPPSISSSTPVSYASPSVGGGAASGSTTTPINGLFLGLEKPTPPTAGMGVNNYQNDYDEDQYDENGDDKEVQRAREAALYAEEMLKAEKAKRKKAGPLGFGLLPKAQQLIPKNLPSAPTISMPSMPSIPSSTSGTTGGGSSDVGGPSITVNADDAAGHHGLAPGETPPWYSTNNKNLNSSEDYGISGGVNQVDASGAGGSEKKQSVGRGAAVTGAAAIGGIAGLIAVGPLVGVAAAGGVAYAAATKDGVLGKGIRGAGGLVAQAGSGLKKIEDQTGIAKGTANGIAKGMSWVMKKAVDNS